MPRRRLRNHHHGIRVMTQQGRGPVTHHGLHRRSSASDTVDCAAVGAGGEGSAVVPLRLPNAVFVLVSQGGVTEHLNQLFFFFFG
jgi:hypothetical protein